MGSLPGDDVRRDAAYHPHRMDDSTHAPSLLAAVRILARGGDLVTRLAALAAEAGTAASARCSLVLLYDPEAAVIARPDGTGVALDDAGADLVASVVNGRLPAWDVALGAVLAGELEELLAAAHA